LGHGTDDPICPHKKPHVENPQTMLAGCHPVEYSGGGQDLTQAVVLKKKNISSYYFPFPILSAKGKFGP
jgi:hypothetical protein